MTLNGSGRIGEISLGMLCAEDADELERLAQRDTSTVPAGRVLGARLDGRLVAALSVSSGHSVADPFVRTEELQELLGERAAQLLGRGHGLRERMFGRGARRSRAALPASPPGAGGKLLTLPQRAR